jgi:hypothetical protein
VKLPIKRIEYAAGFTTGLAVASVAAALVIWPWGMSVGQRDARLLAEAERHAAVNLCVEGERALMLAGQRSQDDVWICAAGSGRLLSRGRAKEER